MEFFAIGAFKELEKLMEIIGRLCACDVGMTSLVQTAIMGSPDGEYRGRDCVGRGTVVAVVVGSGLGGGGDDSVVMAVVGWRWRWRWRKRQWCGSGGDVVIAVVWWW